MKGFACLVVHLAAVSSLGCAGKHLDLGQQDGGQGGGTAMVFAGYIESYKFGDGSDTVVMNLTFADSGTITGTVRFGTAPDLPLATDPNAAYPPSGTYPFEGFDFTVLGGTYAAPPRVQLSITGIEIYEHWCEIQTTIYPEYSLGAPTDAGCGSIIGYGCVPGHSLGGTFGMGTNCTWISCEYPTPQPIDCTKRDLCTAGICTCTATSCTMQIPLTGPGDQAFDMQLTSGALDGSLTGLDQYPHNVHLTRQ
jgi:hypothetical protein